MLHNIYKDKRKKSGESKRYCSRDWFHSFRFIAYSKFRINNKSEGMKLVVCAGFYLLACVLFPMPDHQGSRAKILVSHSYNG